MSTLPRQVLGVIIVSWRCPPVRWVSDEAFGWAGRPHREPRRGERGWCRRGRSGHRWWTCSLTTRPRWACCPVAMELFSKLHRASTLAFLQAFPTLEAAREAEVEIVTPVLRQAGYPHSASKSREIRARLDQPQLVASPAVVRAKSLLMLSLVEQLSSLVERIAEYDKEIDSLCSQHADARIFRSLPGAGRRLAQRLLAEWGSDRGRYLDASGVKALAGTSPVVCQSGNYSRVRKRHACSRPFRNTLYQYAWASLQKEE